MTSKKDIIIGGGIIGVAAAYYLAQQGREVVLLEKDDLAAGSSYGNAGLIANGFAIPLAAPGVPRQGLKWLLDAHSPFYIKPRLDLNLLSWLWRFTRACNEQQMRRSIQVMLSLGRASFDLFAELLAREDADFGYARRGRLILFTTEAGFAHWAADVALIREFGVEVSLLDAAGVRRIEPHVSPAVRYGIYCEDYAHVIPHRLVQELARLARALGVEIQTGAAVSGFEVSGGRVNAVRTSRGRFPARQVVLAAGAWSSVVARTLKLRLPIQPAKGYSLTYKMPPSAPRLPLSLAERKVAVTPMGERLRFTSTLELSGFDASISPHRLAGIRQAAQNYLPGMEALEDETVWFGYRPATPDDLPIIGPAPRYDNLILATGHGTLGMTYGLVTGKLVSQIASGEQPFIDISPLRATRF